MIYAQNCGKEEYNRCIALADPLVKDPHFIYPGNLKDIDNICRYYTNSGLQKYYGYDSRLTEFAYFCLMVYIIDKI